MENLILNMNNAIKYFLDHEDFVFRKIKDSDSEFIFVIVSDSNSIKFINDNVNSFKNESFLKQLEDTFQDVFKNNGFKQKIIIETEEI